jgi:uncharacterized protein YhaN
MLFVELAAQAVRGFSPSVRVALKPGYVGLKSPTEVPAPLGALLLALCYPDGRGGDLSFLAPGSKAGRAGVSVQAQDQQLWRVVRDLGGTGGLHKLNRQTNQYEVVTQDAVEMGQVLRSTVGFPTRTALEQGFFFTGGQLPSRRPRSRPTLTPSRGQRSLQSSSYEQYGGASDPAQAGQRIAQLEKELVSAREAAELQFKQDGVQGDLFKAESRLKAYAELKAKVEAARKELAACPTPESLGLPTDIVQRVARVSDDRKRRDEALAKLQAEKAQALDESAFSVQPLHADRRFLFATVATLGLLVGGAFLHGAGRWIALGAIPLASLATLMALRFVEDLQRRGRESAKTDVFAQREKKVLDEFQLSTMWVQTAFDKTSTSTADEFEAAMARREQLQPQVGVQELELADLESDPEILELPEHVAELKAEQEDLNRKLSRLSGGYVREVREVERDLARLREPAAAPEEPGGSSGGSGELFEDPCPAVMKLGAELFATDPATLWGVLRDRTVQYLKALSEQRYLGVDLSGEGRATLQAQGRTVPATELSGKDLDLLYLSLRLTLVEKYSAQGKLPVVIEDTLGTAIEPGKQGLLGRMLKHLGSLTQVLHVTGNAQTLSAVEVTLTL